MSNPIMYREYQEKGFVTAPFPSNLKQEMLAHINTYMNELANVQNKSHSIEEIVHTIPDELWQYKLRRCFRIFPNAIAQSVLDWAHNMFCSSFGFSRSAVNVVFPQEAQENPKISDNHLAIYWRCVRPGKKDAGRPHRDASFWDLEFSEGYNPKIPFEFNYLKNCKKIWIPLYGCNPKTVLQVIPGSHVMNIPTIVEQTEYGRRPGICPEWLNAKKNLFISPQELSQGSSILFDMNLVHVGPCHDQPFMRLSAELNFITQ
jgi:hypothetical protein